MTSNVRILYDANLFGIEEMLQSTLCEFMPFSTQNEFDALAPEFDAAIIRTVTKISSNRLKNKGKLKHIATASAGFDHIDTNFLNRINLPFSTAVGSNAQSVAEYVFTAISLISLEENLDLKQFKVGIVGLGNVGSALKQILDQIGVKTICYDPPKEQRDQNFTSCSMQDLSETELLSFHVPYISNGKYATRFMFKDHPTFWSNPFTAVINTSRGGVLDENLLLDAKNNSKIKFLISDVWENEPHYNPMYRKAQYLATPHIAGYSAEAKVRASWMSLKAISIALNVEFCGDFEDWCRQLLVEDPAIDELNKRWSSTDRKINKRLLYDLINAHPILKYHNALANLDHLKTEARGEAFQQLRKQTKLRREFGL